MLCVCGVAVPAIIYIDKWGRRPMLLIGTFLMGFWLMLVGGLQGGFGHWGEVDGSGAYPIPYTLPPLPPPTNPSSPPNQPCG